MSQALADEIVKTATLSEGPAPSSAEPLCFGLKLLGAIERPLGPLLGRLVGLPAPDFIGHRLLTPSNDWSRLGLRVHGSSVKVRARVFEATVGVEVLDVERLYSGARQVHRRLWPGVEWEATSLAEAAFRVLVNARSAGLSIDSYWTEPVEFPWRDPATVATAALVESRTELLVRAPAAAVWSVLYPLDRWPEWNPDCGAVVPRRDLGDQEYECRIAGFRAEASILEHQPMRRLIWTYALLGVQATQSWELARQGQFTVVRVHGSITGSLAARVLAMPTHLLLDRLSLRWLEALKRRAEDSHTRAALPAPAPRGPF